jgi:ABC-2 type transport system permease protein
MAISGAVLGGAATGITDNLNANQQMTDLLARLGGRAGVTNAFLAAVFSIMGLTIAAYTVQATLRMRAEEASGRLEPLLATRVGRIRWAMSHLVFAVLGTALLLALTGVAGGLAYGGQINDVGHQVARLTGTALAQVPAAWVLAGLGTALFGLFPRLSTSLTWAGLITCFLLLELGALLGLSQWIIDASPFAHVPKLPGAAFTSTPLVVLTLIAAVLAGGGLAAFRRRDIG